MLDSREYISLKTILTLYNYNLFRHIRSCVPASSYSSLLYTSLHVVQSPVDCLGVLFSIVLVVLVLYNAGNCIY